MNKFRSSNCLKLILTLYKLVEKYIVGFPSLYDCNTCNNEAHLQRFYSDIDYIFSFLVEFLYNDPPLLGIYV